MVFKSPADENSKLSVQCEEWRSTLDTVQEARAHDRMHTQQLLKTKVHDYAKKRLITVYIEIFTRRGVSPITPPGLIGENFTLY